ncbi:hypothetical protein PG990_008807 [Apiospora arundinis]
MPFNTFKHHLEHASRKILEEHPKDTWLLTFPKKLKISLRSSNGAQENPNLLFGWGVHIINGPNHTTLFVSLILGVTITLVASLVILGVAKTQEQAFGIARYLQLKAETYLAPAPMNISLSTISYSPSPIFQTVTKGHL